MKGQSIDSKEIKTRLEVSLLTDVQLNVDRLRGYGAYQPWFYFLPELSMNIPFGEQLIYIGAGYNTLGAYSKINLAFGKSKLTHGPGTKLWYTFSPFPKNRVERNELRMNSSNSMYNPNDYWPLWMVTFNYMISYEFKKFSNSVLSVCYYPELYYLRPHEDIKLISYFGVQYRFLER